VARTNMSPQAMGSGEWAMGRGGGEGAGVGVRGLVAQWPQAPARLEEGEKRGTGGCGGDSALVGRGSSSYILGVIMRDEDANTLWDAAVEGDDVIVFAAAWDGGYRCDPATEQYHVRRRVYSPEMGRWTRRDSIE
jgi:hypothetical protein